MSGDEWDHRLYYVFIVYMEWYCAAIKFDDLQKKKRYDFIDLVMRDNMIYVR